MAEQTTFTIPKPNIPSIIEAIIDFAIIATVFWLASGFLLAKEIDLQDQPIPFIMVLGITGIAVKWCLSTKIWKRG